MMIMELREYPNSVCDNEHCKKRMDVTIMFLTNEYVIALCFDCITKASELINNHIKCTT